MQLQRHIFFFRHLLCCAFMLLPLMALTAVVQNARPFIKVQVGSQKIHVGEPVDVSYLLYAEIPSMVPESEQRLEFANCYVQEYPSSHKSWTETIRGKVYHVLLLKKYLLIPLKKGPLNFPVLNVDLKVTLPPAEDDFFQQERMVTYAVSSLNKNVEVQSLVSPNVQMPFSNAVGQFKVKSTYEKKGGSLIFKFSIEGYGNLKAFHPGFGNLPKGLESFDEVRLLKDTLLEKGWYSHYTYTSKLLAHYSGNYHIKGASFLVYNPAKADYEILSTADFHWKVTQGPVMPLEKNAEKLIKQELAKTDVLLQRDLKDRAGDQLFFNSPMFYITVCSVFFFLSLALVFQYFQNKQAENPAFYSYKRAYRRTLTDLKRLKADALNDEDFLNSAAEVLRNFICFRYYISVNNFSVNELLQKIPNETTPISFHHQVIDFLKRQDELRFSGRQGKSINKEKHLKELLVMINQIQYYSK